AIQQVRPHFQPTPPSYPEGYDCKLLETLNDKSGNQAVYSPCSKTLTCAELKEWKTHQIQWESEGQVTVKSIDRQENPSEHTIYLREKLKECEQEWKEVLNKVFEQNLQAQRNQAQSQRGMSLYPYLCVLDPSCYVEIMLQEIRRLAETSETFSPSVHYLHRNLGAKVMNLYTTWIKKENGVADKVSALYDKYLEYYVNPHLTTTFPPRRFWQKLKTVYFHGPTIDSEEVCWPHHVLLGVSNILYTVLWALLYSFLCSEIHIKVM
ncbi:DNA-directed RNA polymerase, mitochondrial-like, partial [Limulus polyphemus]|uniref:DNA-directed RNA polymerase, mitochondrial-like n=1 Tax=Limulus polyphemus TaxID=6850 RepID=A0ABM1RWG4_LIMPO